MKLPEMIIFDYGHTLMHEEYFDGIKGTEAVMKYAVKNRDNLSAREINEFTQDVFHYALGLSNSMIEIHEHNLIRFSYEYLGIEFDISIPEIEEIFWSNASPGMIMEDIDKVLDYLNANNIRSGVISNISFSGEALKRRINNALPNNQFEFIMGSCEYIFKKPQKYIFEAAVRKAELQPHEVWYCGDSTIIDCKGSFDAGLFPVWYQSRKDCDYRDASHSVKPEFDHLHIRDWIEMIDVLEKLKND